MDGWMEGLPETPVGQTVWRKDRRMGERMDGWIDRQTSSDSDGQAV